MNFIDTNVEWWPQSSISQHIAKVGRICYKSEGMQPSPEMTDVERETFVEERDRKRSEAFWKSGHRSMFRHGSVYYFIKHEGKLPKWIWSLFTASSYIACVSQGPRVWISTNMQYLWENEKIMRILEPFLVDEDEFISRATQYKCMDALYLLRMTLVVTTQISTTRELNRTSPNSIAEQSTRYVNFGKKGGVGIAEPHWYGNPIASFSKTAKRCLRARAMFARMAYYCGCKVSEWMYHLLLRLGLTPQDARGVLPLDTFSVVAYTYNLHEWKHILDLRYRGTTGTPHPNAKIIGEKIFNIITNRMKQYNPDFII